MRRELLVNPLELLGIEPVFVEEDLADAGDTGNGKALQTGPEIHIEGRILNRDAPGGGLGDGGLFGVYTDAVLIAGACGPAEDTAWTTGFPAIAVGFGDAIVASGGTSPSRMIAAPTERRMQFERVAVSWARVIP